MISDIFTYLMAPGGLVIWLSSLLSSEAAHGLEMLSRCMAP